MWRIESRFEMLSNEQWEIVLDGDKGYDVIGTFPSWDQARGAIQEWLQSFVEGYVNPDTWGSDGVSEEAIEDDLRALEALQSAEAGKRWSFAFDHDRAAYTLLLQQVS